MSEYVRGFGLLCQSRPADYSLLLGGPEVGLLYSLESWGRREQIGTLYTKTDVGNRATD